MDEANLIDLDYPVPDPAWDYFEVYKVAIALHQEATEMVSRVSEEERGSTEADQVIRDSLQEISQRVNRIMALLD